MITTMVIVLATVFCLGGTTTGMLKCLKIEVDVDEDAYMEDWHRERQQDGLIIRFEDFMQRHATRSRDGEQQRCEPEEEIAPKTPPRETNKPASPIRRVSSLTDYHAHHVEMTEQDTFDAVDRKESLFDYGGEL